MVRRSWATAVAGLLVLGGIGSARADSDTIRLGGSATTGTTTQTLIYSGDATTEQMHRGAVGLAVGGARFGVAVGAGAVRVGVGLGAGAVRVAVGGPYYGGYRSYYGGYAGSFYRPYYAGFYRPYYASYYPFYRPWLAYNSFYRPYCRPYSYGSYYNWPYASSSYYDPYAYVGAASSVPIGSQAYYPPNLPMPTPVMPPAFNGNSTYPYDGGPPNSFSVPIPGFSPAPTSVPQKKTVPVEGRVVSLTAGSSTGVVYPAYGETVPSGPRVESGTRLVSLPVERSRIVYPAYGEQLPTPNTQTAKVQR